MDARTMTIAVDRGQACFDLSPERLEHANINPTTKLATDYLNHFNEVIMLIDMLEMMPECADDVLQWRPKSYQQHFDDSGFAEKDLAILAYDHAPRPIRQAFDQTLAQIDAVILRAQSILNECAHDTHAADATLSTILTDELRPLMDRASGIVNGTLTGESLSPSETAQDAIDALFP